MTNENVFAVVMAGGVGSRYWPASKKSYPKQFVDILGTGESLLQMSYNRYLHICLPQNVFVITNDVYKDLVKEQLPNIDENQVLLEPMRRNTATCMLYAAMRIQKLNPNAIVIASASDHIITNENLFFDALKKSIYITADENEILLLTIKPPRVDENQTYIQVNENPAQTELCTIKTFAEKPTLGIAKAFHNSGDFLWHTGVIICKISDLMSAYKKHLPDMYALFNEKAQVFDTPRERDFINEIYPMCESVSLKNGIIYKTENIKALVAKFGWSNLNTWGDLWTAIDRDYMDNAVVGDNVVMYDSRNCMVYAANNKLVIVQGLNEYIVSDSANALLICKRSDEHHLKNITKIIERKKGERYL